ncbi:hypothetical protein CFC21_108226 [Triticum aestivum]|uniref:DUF1618 domain-containing protein n=3 Tax=Triticinae TaxID=1648030 RepID=A0A9R1NBG6_WHEAT|nr:hypothetical protein CFC21_108226 [Triticum aestivum]
MAGWLDEGSSSSSSSISSSSSSKRRRRDCDCDCAESRRPRRKQHLYLALDDWDGGYSIHKLDADDILDDDFGGVRKLPEPAAIRIRWPVRGPMHFAALGTDIFFAAGPRFHGDDAPPATFVYETQAAALAVGPPLPTGLYSLGAAMAAGRKLYALTSPYHPEAPCLQALSWDLAARGDRADWFWNAAPSSSPPPPCCGMDVVAHALHPDGRTLFVSTDSATHSLDTSDGAWRELGDWVLPFKGQAYFDAGLDAWVGIHRKGDGHVCCCPVASRSAAAGRPPECRVLKGKLFLRNGEKTYQNGGRHLKATLTCMGRGRFCLVENVLRVARMVGDSVLRVTLFSRKYDHMGELRTKVRPRIRSYAVSKNNHMFSHAAF